MSQHWKISGGLKVEFTLRLNEEGVLIVVVKEIELYFIAFG